MKDRIIFILSLLVGLMFINAGLNKFLHYIPVPENLPERMIIVNNAFMEIGWLMPLVAVTEIIGGVLFITKRFRPLGAIVIFPIMIGILLTHIIIAPSGLPIALILLAVNLWVIYEYRERYMPLISHLSSP